MKLTKNKLRKLIQEELENLNVSEEEVLQERTLEAGGVQAQVSGDTVTFSDDHRNMVQVPLELVVSVVEHATGVMLPSKGGFEPVEETFGQRQAAWKNLQKKVTGRDDEE